MGLLGGGAFGQEVRSLGVCPSSLSLYSLAIMKGTSSSVSCSYHDLLPQTPKQWDQETTGWNVLGGKIKFLSFKFIFLRYFVTAMERWSLQYCGVREFMTIDRVACSVPEWSVTSFHPSEVNRLIWKHVCEKNKGPLFTCEPPLDIFQRHTVLRQHGKERLWSATQRWDIQRRYDEPTMKKRKWQICISQ